MIKLTIRVLTSTLTIMRTNAHSRGRRVTWVHAQLDAVELQKGRVQSRGIEIDPWAEIWESANVQGDLGPMGMVRLVYVSRMTDKCDMEALQDILDVARKHNPSKSITGILCYDPTFFLQCLEGPREAVNGLYESILRDDRHERVTLLEYADIQERTFGSWAMGFLSTSDLSKQTLLEFTGTEKFDPYLLSGDRALSFLITIVAQERGRLTKQK